MVGGTKAALAKVDKYARRWMAAYNVPGMSVGITSRERNQAIFTYGYANVDSRKRVGHDTLFEIGSVSKSFACVALMQLREKGLVDVNAPVTLYLPWLEIRTKHEPITLHHLMSHTSGIITGSEAMMAAKSEALALRTIETSTPPGTHFHYSNVGYKIVGLVLEKITGKPITEILRERVVAPLGMKATTTAITNDIRPRLAVGYSPRFDDRFYFAGAPLEPATWIESSTADGSICSTPGDMMRYARMLLSRGRVGGRRLISRESFELMTQRAAVQCDQDSKSYYGYGLAIEEQDGHLVVSHTGGMVGYHTSLALDMDAGVGTFAMVNGPESPTPITSYVLKALRAAREGREIPGPPEADPLRVENGQEYAGFYAGSDRKLVVEHSKKHLSLKDGKRRLPLQRIDGDTFVLVGQHEAYPLSFSRTEGRVVELNIGPDSFRRDGGETDEPTVTESPLSAFTGHYRSYNPWLSNFRVVLRRGSLVMISPSTGESPLVQLEDGSFRVGIDERCPERIRFHAMVEGKAQRANLSGGEYSRFFDV